MSASEEKFVVFIVEDEPSISMLVERMINQHFPKASVHCFDSVERAISNNKLKPRIILLDHYLKHTNGIEALEVVKEFMPDSIIAITSSQTDVNMFMKAYKDGAKLYIKKDEFYTENVRQFIEKQLEK